MTEERKGYQHVRSRVDANSAPPPALSREALQALIDEADLGLKASKITYFTVGVASITPEMHDADLPPVHVAGGMCGQAPLIAYGVMSGMQRFLEAYAGPRPKEARAIIDTFVDWCEEMKVKLLKEDDHGGQG